MEETDHSKSSEPETHHVSKKRRLGERVVVAVKLEENDKRQQQRNEGPPSDCWSWRKYGQKPIKGSPYPRGYYRCSTSKGCSAKKQVEKCKTDSSMLIVTYTSSHNHPGPGKSPANRSPQNNQHSKQEQDEINTSSTPKQEQEESESESMVPGVAVDDTLEANLQAPGELYSEDLKLESEMMVPRVAVDSEDHRQHSQSPSDSTVVHVIPFEANLQTPVGPYSEDPKPASNGDDDTAEFSSLLNSEENDFFDELEELPTSSFFTSLMKRSFCEDRVIVNPS